MQVEPSWSIPIVAIAGVAVFYVWWLLAHATILDKPLAYPREHWGSLWMCPFCACFWLSGLLLLVTGTYDPVTHLAVTGVAGVMGSHNS